MLRMPYWVEKHAKEENTQLICLGHMLASCCGTSVCGNIAPHMPKSNKTPPSNTRHNWLFWVKRTQHTGKRTEHLIQLDKKRTSVFMKKSNVQISAISAYFHTNSEHSTCNMKILFAIYSTCKHCSSSGLLHGNTGDNGVFTGRAIFSFVAGRSREIST